MNPIGIGSFSAPSQIVRSAPPSSEAGEGPGPDKVNDHDSDDLPSKAPTAAGTGGKVDITA